MLVFALSTCRLETSLLSRVTISLEEFRVTSSRKKSPGDHDQLLGRWMVGYQSGDGDSFEQLYDNLAHDLRGYFLFLCGDRERSEDLLQECFLQIHKGQTCLSCLATSEALSVWNCEACFSNGLSFPGTTLSTRNEISSFRVVFFWRNRAFACS